MKLIARYIFSCAAVLAAPVAAGEAQTGMLDPSFGEQGDGRQIVKLDYADAGAASLAVDNGNRILLAGDAKDANNRQRGAITRLLPDGKPDIEYANALAPLPPTAAGGHFDALATSADGGAVAVGISSGGEGACIDQQDCWYVCKVTPSGEYDESFGDGLSLGCTSALEGLPGGATAVATQSGGRVVIAGYDNRTNPARGIVLRLLANGELDQSFGEGGIWTPPSDYFLASEFYAVSIAPDQSIAVAGTYTSDSNSHFLVARLTADGEPLTGFSGGIRMIPFTHMPYNMRRSFANSINVANDGTVIAGGITLISGDGSYRPALVKLDANGDGVDAFGMPGLGAGQRVVDTCEAPPCTFNVSRTFVRDNGSIVLAGQVIYSEFSILNAYAMRLTADGTIDTSFASNDGSFSPGVATAWWPEAQNFAASGMQVGKAVLAGKVLENDTLHFAAIRFGGNGIFADGFDLD